MGLLFIFSCKMLNKGCGTVKRTVTSDTRDWSYKDFTAYILRYTIFQAF